ncbi:MAG: hypothetical protein NE327_00995 [Lentisphaeraceae bacterium]|nr:hypothetical protein [Lentisphaeraceae bacterium]
MKNRAFTLLISVVGLCVVLTSCQSKVSELKPIEKPVMVQNDDSKVDVNIHIRHFTTKKCLQGVSSWVYSELPVDVRDNYKKEETFVRHHEYKFVKTGTCDNTVELYDEKTGSIVYRCGGHTMARR